MQGQVHSDCEIRVTLLIMGLAALRSYIPQLIECSLRMLILATGGSEAEGGENLIWEKGTCGVLLQAVSEMMSMGGVRLTIDRKAGRIKTLSLTTSPLYQ
jgi:hypothetical protein